MDRAERLYNAARPDHAPTWRELPETTRSEFIRYVARPTLATVQRDILVLLRGLKFNA